MRKLLSLFALPLAGCSLLIGNVRPVEEKSDRYSYLNLNKIDPAWKSQNTESDVEYQSQLTSSTISLNSTCRESWRQDPPNLDTSIRQLLLGFNAISEQKIDPASVSGASGKQTRFDGELGAKKVRVQLLTAQKSGCLYDLAHVTSLNLKLEDYQREEAQFKQFVETLQIK